MTFEMVLHRHTRGTCGEQILSFFIASEGLVKMRMARRGEREGWKDKQKDDWRSLVRLPRRRTTREENRFEFKENLWQFLPRSLRRAVLITIQNAEMFESQVAPIIDRIFVFTQNTPFVWSHSKSQQFSLSSLNQTVSWSRRQLRSMLWLRSRPSICLFCAFCCWWLERWWNFQYFVFA